MSDAFGRCQFHGQQCDTGGKCPECYNSIFAAPAAAPGAAAPATPTPDQVAEACALVCESRADSLFHQSHRPAESNEAGKCAMAIRGWPGWRNKLPAALAGAPGRAAPEHKEP